MAINNGVFAEMEIPDAYFETLPKSGKSCLGDAIYRYMTAEQFSGECLLDCLDLSSEHQTLEIANGIEAATHVWRLKEPKKSTLHKGKMSWGGKVKGLVMATEKSQFLAQRTEGLLQSLRLSYPCLPQTVLDMNKIPYNQEDVGQTILESYSQVMESLAFNLMERIDDLIFVDDATKKCIVAGVNLFNLAGRGSLPIRRKISPSPFSVQTTPYASPFATPFFCSSTPVAGSPRSVPTHLSHIKDGFLKKHVSKRGLTASNDVDKI